MLREVLVVHSSGGMMGEALGMVGRMKEEERTI